MNPLTRREALAALSAAACGASFGSFAAGREKSLPRTSLGMVTYALGLHQKHGWGDRSKELSPALALLEESHQLGACGIMADFGAKDAPTINEVRRRSEEYEMYIEASIMPPKSADDVARFESDVRLAQAAGASLARTVVFPGRRYEQFKTLADFKDHEKRALQLLQWAVPVLEKQKFQLAVENHKDQRVPEKLELLKTLGSEYVGICVDVGNSFTLLEDPLETVRAYAPFAMTVHLKDQAVRENENGFLFADVPLGEGFLPLQEMVRVLKQAKPAIHLGLELITRDALDVPVLTPDYWVTMPDVPATELAQALKVVRAHSSRNPFAVVSSLPAMKQMALETHNLQQSMTFWRAALAGK